MSLPNTMQHGAKQDGIGTFEAFRASARCEVALLRRHAAFNKSDSTICVDQVPASFSRFGQKHFLYLSNQDKLR